jgi:hypothetical protein
MGNPSRLAWIAAGFLAGIVAAALYVGSPRQAFAANDRYEDYIIATGPVAVARGAQTDGVWLLDYRGGKLLATVIDRGVGKIAPWAEADLASEFNIAARQNVHFVMTTGRVTQGQGALYVAETTTGKFAVYTMGPRLDGLPGVLIRRHDMSNFRQPVAAASN